MSFKNDFYFFLGDLPHYTNIFFFINCCSFFIQVFSFMLYISSTGYISSLCFPFCWVLWINFVHSFASVRFLKKDIKLLFNSSSTYAFTQKTHLTFISNWIAEHCNKTWHRKRYLEECELKRHIKRKLVTT